MYYISWGTKWAESGSKSSRKLVYNFVTLYQKHCQKVFLKLVRALKFDGSSAKYAIPKNKSTEKILAKKHNGLV